MSEHVYNVHVLNIGFNRSIVSRCLAIETVFIYLHDEEEGRGGLGTNPTRSLGGVGGGGGDISSCRRHKGESDLLKWLCFKHLDGEPDILVSPSPSPSLPLLPTCTTLLLPVLTTHPPPHPYHSPSSPSLSPTLFPPSVLFTWSLWSKL